MVLEFIKFPLQNKVKVHEKKGKPTWVHCPEYKNSKAKKKKKKEQSAKIVRISEKAVRQRCYLWSELYQPEPEGTAGVTGVDIKVCCYDP